MFLLFFLSMGRSQACEASLMQYYWFPIQSLVSIYSIQSISVAIRIKTSHDVDGS